jgi:hypothetical protein
VQGTKGLFSGYPHRLYIEGRGRATSGWMRRPLRAEFEHPLWKEMASESPAPATAAWTSSRTTASSSACAKACRLDMTVYDAAALSAIVDTSVRSVAKNGQPCPFPISRAGAGAHAAPRHRPRVSSASIDDGLTAAFVRLGVAPADVAGRVELARQVVSGFEQHHGRAPVWLYWVPGRIEVFGKHTDYAGGRSLVAAVPRGFVVPPHRVTTTVCGVRHALECAMRVDARNGDQAFAGWPNYIAVVVRRLARNFPGARLVLTSRLRAICRGPRASAALGARGGDRARA